MANEQIQIAKAANRDVPDCKPSPSQDCSDVIHISVFFDGTGNNKDVDTTPKKWSNVARMFFAAEMCSKQSSNVYPIYISGIGTPYNGNAVNWLSKPNVWNEDKIKGLGFGGDLPVVGVCTLMALAQASGADKVIACLDARMGEVYHAAYEKVSGEWQAVIEPGLYKPDAVPAIQGGGWVGVGSGWQTYGEQLSNIYAAHISVMQPALLPTASAILKLAEPVFASGQAKPAHDAMPIYIRNRVALKTAEREQGLRL